MKTTNKILLIFLIITCLSFAILLCFSYSRIRNLEAEVYNLIQGNKNNKFCFDEISTKVILQHYFVKLGDTIRMNVFVRAKKTYSRSDALKYPYVIIGDEFDTTSSRSKLKNIYDTIPMKNWECYVNHKAEKLGINYISGQVFIPNEESPYLFMTEINVIDNFKYKQIPDFIKQYSP